MGKLETEPTRLHMLQCISTRLEQARPILSESQALQDPYAPGVMQPIGNLMWNKVIFSIHFIELYERAPARDFQAHVAAKVLLHL